MIDLIIAPYHFGPDHRLLILENEGKNSLKRIARVDPRLPNGQGPKLARLFAAAPDLLTALEGVFNKYAEPCFQGDPNTMEPEWETAHVAIAKARQ